MRGLLARQVRVVGLGRDAATGRRLVPDAGWIGADMAHMTRAEDWTAHLAGVDVVVNAAGALQDGARDRLDTVHDASVRACIAAAEAADVRRFIQISAPGASATASTKFLRSKGAGDAALAGSALDWTIFRPGLVIGRDAYGGTALLRLLAGFPIVQPLAHAEARVQTVFIDDVVAAVVAAVEGRTPARNVFDLVENESTTLRTLIGELRRRLGFAPARLEIAVPGVVASIVGLLADLAGALGWRSPLRTTAMKVMAEGVLGDPGPWGAAGDAPLRDFRASLRMLTPSAQERAYARMQLLAPVVIVALAAFWIVSGVVGAVSLEAAAALLPALDAGLARALVLGGAAADIAIGAGFLWRRTTRAAAVAAILLSLAYLVAGSLMAPALWADPLGPYVKIFPAIVLAFVAAVLPGER